MKKKRRKRKETETEKQENKLKTFLSYFYKLKKGIVRILKQMPVKNVSEW